MGPLPTAGIGRALSGERTLSPPLARVPRAAFKVMLRFRPGSRVSGDVPDDSAEGARAKGTVSEEALLRKSCETKVSKRRLGCPYHKMA